MMFAPSPSRFFNFRHLTATSLWLSAALLFWIQPLVAKFLLPIVGGTPAVWHTVIVFFQATVLLGYCYAHLLSTCCPIRLQFPLHASLFLVALIYLSLSPQAPPIKLSQSSTATMPLFLWYSLFVQIGLPCFIISATAPLLQAWYSQTSMPDSNDPFFLYQSSNRGSLIALLSFPLLLESTLPLDIQYRSWWFGMVALGGLIGGTQVFKRRLPAHSITFTGTAKEPNDTSHRGIHRRVWFGLAYLSSSLLLATTHFITTEVINAPLTGVLPLALFLITYILAFAKQPIGLCRWSGTGTLLATMAVTFQWLVHATDPAWLVTLIHLTLVFFGCLFLHHRLAQHRPYRQHLTHYYLWMSLGGVAAGITLSMLCPIVFDQVWEYPLVIASLALMAANAQTDRAGPHRIPMIAAGTAITLPLLPRSGLITPPGLPGGASQIALLGAVVATYLTSRTPRLLSVTLLALFAISAWQGDGHGKTIFTDRNFFGVTRVTLDANGLSKVLVHGNTIHGRQALDPREQGLPLSYYHQAGPLRRIFKQYEANATVHQVALIGLGAGSALAYGQAHQKWTLYEIDPLMIQLASDSDYFTFLSQARVDTWQIEQGDARIQLQSAKPSEFDLIVIDAFSSDSIPIHLLTHEALELYLSKLDESGLLAFHISNRILDLGPILARLADHLSLHSLAWNDPHDAPNQGKDPSHWAVLTRDENHLNRLAKDERWKPLSAKAGTRLWTDQRSNVLEALRTE